MPVSPAVLIVQFASIVTSESEKGEQIYMPAGTNRAKKTPDNGKRRSNVLKLDKIDASKVKPLEAVDPAVKPVVDPNEVVFALDIGTRTVVGVVGIQEDSRFRIITTEVVGHKSRAMFDGQIHDIEQVAAVTREVKEKIEARLGFALKKVAIAAAGRVLKTCQVRVDKDLEAGREIDQEMVGSLEIDGIQRAQLMLDEDAAREDKDQFYCVGYSVINYYLNGYIISTLTGHKGKTAGADILATFLPHIVVDSLYTVMNKVGLEVSSLTLEPIAAINVTIPPDLRLLNLALVDVGAGTSDIALTRDGSVIAYAMAPTAGDKITERISQHYLVDFNTAEKIKIALSASGDNISFIDILKMKHSVKASEIITVIKATVEFLADTISRKILEYNNKAPNAVFLIGGGSRIPGLPGMIAERLKLPGDRVVVRGRDVIRNVKFNDRKLSGPESITPYGIAVTAQMQKGRDFLTVTVNDGKIKLFNSKRLSVADALILIGFNPGQLIGRTGKSISFTLNGEKKLVRGEYGRAAEIFVNQAPAGLDTYIKHGDGINVIPAQNGKDADLCVSDVADSIRAGRVMLNGSFIDVGTNIVINGKAASAGSKIKEGDAVEIHEIRTLSELLKAGGLDVEGSEILVNGKKQGSDYILENSDIVECCLKDSSSSNPTGEMTGPDDSAIDPDQVRVTVNGKEIVLKENKTQYIFVDVFNYINFDLTKPQGNIVLRLNGRQAAFTDSVRSGDIIEIYWQK